MDRQKVPELAEIVELTQDEVLEYRGGDWWEYMMGAMIASAFLGGVAGSAPLLATGVVIGGAILATDALLTWY
jgi:hypothetical protein